jgi:hypothetical protein
MTTKKKLLLAAITLPVWLFLGTTAALCWFCGASLAIELGRRR